MKKIMLCGLLFISAYLQAGASAPPKANDKDEYEKVMYNWTRTFAEVMNLALRKHFSTERVEQAMIKAIDTFLTTLDPHSGFLEPKTYKSMLESTSGTFFGIGIVLDNTRKSKDKFLVVVDTIPEGPADKAGLRPLDKIIEIEGKPLEGMTTEEATTLLKGERNTKVKVKVLREGQPDLLSFEITRDVVKEQNSLSFHIKDHDIYYLSLNVFSENAVKQIETLLKKAQDHPFKGLILDLRNNSGGLLTAAVDIAGLFLDKGSLVVITKDKEGKETDRYQTTRNPIANGDLPIFILINNYTASAAEILAGFLKTHSEELSRAGKKAPQVFLIGTKTFGKGSVQEVIPVSNNCAVKITTSLYYLPNGITIQGEGIEPDFRIERTLPATEQMQWFTKYYGRESALENHIQPHGKKKDEKKNEEKKDTAQACEHKSAKERWRERAKQMLKTDNQLREAIALVGMLDTAKKNCPQLVTNRQKTIDFLGHQFVVSDSLDVEDVHT